MLSPCFVNVEVTLNKLFSDLSSVPKMNTPSQRKKWENQEVVLEYEGHLDNLTVIFQCHFGSRSVAIMEV